MIVTDNCTARQIDSQSGDVQGDRLQGPREMSACAGCAGPHPDHHPGDCRSVKTATFAMKIRLQKQMIEHERSLGRRPAVSSVELATLRFALDANLTIDRSASSLCHCHGQIVGYPRDHSLA